MPHPFSQLRFTVTFEAKVDVLEERITNLERVLREHIENDEKALEEIESKLDKVLSVLDKYKGFIGGLLFAASAVGAVVTLAISYFGK